MFCGVYKSTPRLTVLLCFGVVSGCLQFSLKENDSWGSSKERKGEELDYHPYDPNSLTSASEKLPLLKLLFLRLKEFQLWHCICNSWHLFNYVEEVYCCFQSIKLYSKCNNIWAFHLFFIILLSCINITQTYLLTARVQINLI